MSIFYSKARDILIYQLESWISFANVQKYTSNLFLLRDLKAAVVNLLCNSLYVWSLEITSKASYSIFRTQLMSSWLQRPRSVNWQISRRISRECGKERSWINRVLNPGRPALKTTVLTPSPPASLTLSKTDRLKKYGLTVQNY